MTLRLTCPPVVALMLMLTAGPLAAQQTLITVRGVVVDEATGAPIAGAYVGLRDSNKGTPTNSEGSFLLRDVPQGSIVEVTQLGYAAWIQRVENASTLRVTLNVNPIVMDQLEVVTDRLADRWRASAVPARSFTTEQILAAPVASARDFAYLRASFGPCPNGRADCIYRRGEWHSPSICIDDIPYGSDMNALAGIPPHDIHVFELVGGTAIYVYTKQFAERLALGKVRLMPRLLVSNSAC